MKKYFIFFLAMGTLVACDKDKFETKPQISIKSSNFTELPFNRTLVVTLEFTDKEGDVSDSLFVLRERVNAGHQLAPPSIDFKIPDFPNRNQGEFEISFDFQTQLTNGLPSIPVPGNPTQKVNDTLNLKFVARDKEGNLSDTVVLSNLVVERR